MHFAMIVLYYQITTAKLWPPSLCELLDILRPLKEITEINFCSCKPPFAVRSVKSFVPLCVWMIFQTTEWRLVKRKNSYGFLLGLKKRLVGGAKRRMTFRAYGTQLSYSCDGPCVSRGSIICSSGEWKNTFY